jgi:hypothetical protein
LPITYRQNALRLVRLVSKPYRSFCISINIEIQETLSNAA